MIKRRVATTVAVVAFVCYGAVSILLVTAWQATHRTREEGGESMAQTVPRLEHAVFAGGCFWCMEPPFAGLKGVVDVVAGYTGGTVADPDYEQVCTGTTGHYEAVKVSFDPHLIAYSELLDVFWESIDPIDPGGQFADRGSQYLTAIFVDSPEQLTIAEISRAALDASEVLDAPVATTILEAQTFYPAEHYHQDYHLKQPARYCAYKQGSGREAFLNRVWGADAADATDFSVPDDAQLRQSLTEIQYNVAVIGGTEPAFANEHWNRTDKGVYADIVTGQPLFSSRSKYESGTGWPSFTAPIAPGLLIYTVDNTSGEARVEVRSKLGGTHLGHVFADGPEPYALRFCMNSSALRFVPD